MAKKTEKLKMEKPKLRKLIYQGNPLVQARKEFTTPQMRLFLLGLRGLNPHFSLRDKQYDEKFPELFIPTARLTELLGGNTWYLHELEDVCSKFFDAKIHLRYEDGGFTLMHIFRRLDYVVGEGLYLQFDELMRPYLLDLFQAKGYTEIEVEQVFLLTSTYSVRLVEIMLQYQNIANFKEHAEIKRELNLEQLRFMLNVPEGSYDGRVDNFRKFILDAPIAEINEKTLYEMSYTVIKQGRNVTGFELRMKLPIAPKEISLEFGERAIEELKRLGFTEQAAMGIWKKCNNTEDCLKRIITAQKLLSRQKRKNGVENELGFLRQAIEENWQLPTKTPARLKPAQMKAPKQPSFAEVMKPQKNKPITRQKRDSTPRKAISPTEIEMVKEWLSSERTAKFVPRLLKDFNLTVAEFKSKYL